MKYSLIILLVIFPYFIGSACNNEMVEPDSANTQNKVDENEDAMSNKIIIKIGDKTFTATLSDNATATAFKDLLPVTITMIELNGNEKYFNLSGSLPPNASRPSSIQAGDLMLYGSSTFVIFYKTFSTTYSYTRLGRIDEPAGLAAALGDGNVSVTIER